MRRRFSGRIHVLPGYSIHVDPKNENLEDTLNLIKVMAFCFSCRNFNIHESSKRVKIEKGIDSMPNKIKHAAEVKPVLSVPFKKDSEFAFPGECSFYHVTTDGNKIVRCPHYDKRRQHRLGGFDKINLINDDTGETVTMTGSEIYNIKHRLAREREERG